MKYPFCPCGCGKLLTGKQKAASASCRKRLERSRKAFGSSRLVSDPKPSVTFEGIQLDEHGRIVRAMFSKVAGHYICCGHCKHIIPKRRALSALGNLTNLYDATYGVNGRQSAQV